MNQGNQPFRPLSRNDVSSRFSLGVTLAVGVALLACYYQSESTIEDVGEQIALKLLEILPRKHRQQQQQQVHREEVRDKEVVVFDNVPVFC